VTWSAVAIESFLARVTCGDWVFQHWPNQETGEPYNPPRIYVGKLVPDEYQSDANEDPAHLDTLIEARPTDTEMSLMLKIWQAMDYLDAHERMEQFKIDGERVVEPHPAGGEAYYPERPDGRSSV
jgi:hypothetical protein